MAALQEAERVFFEARLRSSAECGGGAAVLAGTTFSNTASHKQESCKPDQGYHGVKKIQEECQIKTDITQYLRRSLGLTNRRRRELNPLPVISRVNTTPDVGCGLRKSQSDRNLPTLPHIMQDSNQKSRFHGSHPVLSMGDSGLRAATADSNEMYNSQPALKTADSGLRIVPAKYTPMLLPQSVPEERNKMLDSFKDLKADDTDDNTPENDDKIQTTTTPEDNDDDNMAVAHLSESKRQDLLRTLEEERRLSEIDADREVAGNWILISQLQDMARKFENRKKKKVPTATLR